MMNVLFRPVTPLVGAHCLNWSQSLKTHTGLVACLSIFIPLTAWAQTSERDPFDTRTAPASTVYESAFSDYKPYQDPEIISWKTANDVVREFGGMTAMKGMGDDSSSAHDAHQAGGNEQSKQPAQPNHNGSQTPQGTPAATPPSAPSNSKPAEMKPMPGHDMSKMPQKAPASTPKPAPAPKPAAPAMPSHGGMSH